MSSLKGWVKEEMQEHLESQTEGMLYQYLGDSGIESSAIAL